MQDECNELSASQYEVTFQPKTGLRLIDNKTGKHFLDSPEIEDKAGPLLRRDPSGSAVSGDRNAGH